MAFEVKCSRCDRRYSGFHTKCPYCGARRSKKGKRAENDNAKFKMIISLLLLIVLIVAVIVLIVTSVTSGDEDDEVSPSSVVEDVVPEDDSLSSVSSEPIETEEPEATPEPTETVVTTESISIKLWGSTITDITISVGESYTLSYDITPSDSEDEIVWSSSDDDALVVLQSGNITGIATGTYTVTVTAGEASAECIVRIKSAS